MARAGNALRLTPSGRGEKFFLERYAQLGERVRPMAELVPSLRVNTNLISHEDFCKRMSAIGVSLEKIPWARDGYWITKSPFSPGAIAEYLLGYFYLQESAAQLPVQALDPKEGETVLDMAASPGGKATQISEWMKGKGTVIALERKPHRMHALKINLERMRTPNVIAYQMDAYRANTIGMQFDKILLDAPCSGNFITDSRWFEKRTVPDIERAAKIQLALLRAAVKSLKPGGVLVYSTCSLEPEEDEMNIDKILIEFPQIALEKIDLQIGDPGIDRPFGITINPSVRKCRRLWPNKTKTEGFFIAKLRKCM
jgi:NOL1/NOP2/sun family putative RNA methylase